MLCVQILYKKKDTHTHTIMIPSPGAEGRGPGMVPQAGSSAQAGASGVYIAVFPIIPPRQSCNVLLFVMVEQLCVNIWKSLKKPETQLHPVLIIPPPCGSQAAVLEEASAQILWGRLEPGRGSLDLGRASACCFSPGWVGWVRAPGWVEAA